MALQCMKCTVAGMRRSAILPRIAAVVVLGLGLGLYLGREVFDQGSAAGTDGLQSQQDLVAHATALVGLQASRGFFPLDADTLASLDPTATFIVDGIATTSGEFAISSGTLSGVPVIGIATVTASGRCFTLTQPPLEDVEFRATAQFEPSADSPCSGVTALARGGSGW
jgi:hypothetical protein